MARGSTFVTLDMPESAIAYMALQEQLRMLVKRLDRPDLPEGYKETVEHQRELARRIRKRLVNAGVKTLGEVP